MIRCPWMVTNRKKQHKQNSNAYSLFPTKSVMKNSEKTQKQLLKGIRCHTLSIGVATIIGCP